MLFSIAMSAAPAESRLRAVVAVALVASTVGLAACKRSEPPPDLLKTQRDAMDRAKDVGNTMQKGVDAEGRKADEEGR